MPILRVGGIGAFGLVHDSIALRHVDVVLGRTEEFVGIGLGHCESSIESLNRHS